MTIKFNPQEKDHFFIELKKQVHQHLGEHNLLWKAKLLLWIKLFFYFSLFVGSYLFLLAYPISSFSGLVAIYILIGMSGILLAFNASHDASHATFSRKKWINSLIYHLTFNLQGVNAYLWKIRHISSHHLFPNVDGCDADIDDNFLIKLSPSRKAQPFHKYQHLYATPLYCLYTLHWIFIKDFIYLRKKNLANLKNLNHPPLQIFLLLAWKVFYLTYILLIPVLLGYTWTSILAAFFIMHVVISLFFVWSLIISHLTMETQFPTLDKEGHLPFNYARHQLAVSLDYHPQNYLANWIYGGFNSHAAHHLFPYLPHTSYVAVSKIIKRLSTEFNYPYHQLSIPRAILSHYRFLKKMGERGAVDY